MPCRGLLPLLDEHTLADAFLSGPSQGLQIFDTGASNGLDEMRRLAVFRIRQFPKQKFQSLPPGQVLAVVSESTARRCVVDIRPVVLDLRHWRDECPDARPARHAGRCVKFSHLGLFLTGNLESPGPLNKP